MHRLRITLCAALTLLSAVPAPAATLLWSVLLGEDTAQFDFSVDQLVADGAGGCVAVVNRYDNNANQEAVIVVRFDKKGTALWSKLYPDTYDIEISYTDKKIVIGTRSPVSGDETVIAIDLAGTETTISEANTDIYSDPNGEIGPTGDKKGFFVIAADSSGAYVLRRYSYK